MSEKKVCLAMSGGVDSTAAVVILKREGWEVTGVTLDMGVNPEGIAAASQAAGQLGIRHSVIDCSHAFDDKVISPFISDYLTGLTPSPCVICNRDIKFKYISEFAEANGIEYIATGHYAQIAVHPDYGKCIVKAEDVRKDQSYMLSLIGREILNRIVFPLGKYSKAEVRAIAAESGLQCANTKDSQDICFDGGDYRSFLTRSTLKDTIKSGNFIDKNGCILGRHDGYPFYTIGQRKGLGISSSRPLYVLGKVPELNTVILGDDEDLYKSHVLIGNLNIQVDTLPHFADVKLRYSTSSGRAEITLRDGNIELDFLSAQRAPCPGQIAALYDGDILLGGGTIIGSK